MILLDTNVISELARVQPSAQVQLFVEAYPADVLFTAAVCAAELRHGLARMPKGRKRDALEGRVLAFLAEGFEERILPFDNACAERYGEIRTSREAAGLPITTEDAMIAATAAVYGAAVATRDVSGFGGCGIEVINPWIAG